GWAAEGGGPWAALARWPQARCAAFSVCDDTWPRTENAVPPSALNFGSCIGTPCWRMQAAKASSALRWAAWDGAAGFGSPPQAASVAAARTRMTRMGMPYMERPAAERPF